MKIGFVGLGKMGLNLSLSMMDKGHKLIAYDITPPSYKELKKLKLTCTSSLSKLIELLPSPKIVWLMLPSGIATSSTLKELLNTLEKGSIVIDAGNSHFKDSIKRFEEFKTKQIYFLDCGTSGGIAGAKKGACMMFGGDKIAYDIVEPIIKDICVPNGFGYIGKSGSGHFTKMIHNGIEYGMMGAIAEGMEALKTSDFKISLSEVSRIYSNGSIIESKLMSLVNKSFQKENYLDQISGVVPKGETEDKMRYLVKNTNMVLLKKSILMRVQTRKKESFAGKIISAMRNQFGGHSTNKKK